MHNAYHGAYAFFTGSGPGDDRMGQFITCTSHLNAQDLTIYNELTKRGDVDRILEQFQSMNYREQNSLVQIGINSHKDHTTGDNIKSTLIVLAVELGVKYVFENATPTTTYELHVQHVQRGF